MSQFLRDLWTSFLFGIKLAFTVTAAFIVIGLLIAVIAKG